MRGGSSHNPPPPWVLPMVWIAAFLDRFESTEHWWGIARPVRGVVSIQAIPPRHTRLSSRQRRSGLTHHPDPGQLSKSLSDRSSEHSTPTLDLCLFNTAQRHLSKPERRSSGQHDGREEFACLGFVLRLGDPPPARRCRTSILDRLLQDLGAGFMASIYAAD
jgi:hypothetical protein